MIGVTSRHAGPGCSCSLPSFTPLGLADARAAQDPVLEPSHRRPRRLDAGAWDGGFAGMIGAVAGMMAAPIDISIPNMMSGRAAL